MAKVFLFHSISVFYVFFIYRRKHYIILLYSWRRVYCGCIILSTNMLKQFVVFFPMTLFRLSQFSSFSFLIFFSFFHHGNYEHLSLVVPLTNNTTMTEQVLFSPLLCLSNLARTCSIFKVYITILSVCFWKR